MTTLVFDTHAFVKRLTSAGMPLEQAEILAEEQAKLIDERLVTKAYLDERIRELEYRLTIRLGGMMVAAVGIVATLVKLL